MFPDDTPSQSEGIAAGLLLPSKLIPWLLILWKQRLHTIGDRLRDSHDGFCDCAGHFAKGRPDRLLNAFTERVAHEGEEACEG